MSERELTSSPAQTLSVEEDGEVKRLNSIRDEVVTSFNSRKKNRNSNIADDHETEVEKLSQLIKDTSIAFETMEHAAEQLQDQFQKVYPGSSAFIGNIRERHLFSCGNKERLTKEDAILEKSDFAAVYALLNGMKTDEFYSWLSEFMDLILVAAVVKLANHDKYQFKKYIKSSTDHAQMWHTSIDSFVIYLAIFTCFTCHTFHIVRFTDIPGVLDDYLHIMVGFGNTIFALYIPELSKMFRRPGGLICGWWLSMFALFCLHLQTYFTSHNKSGKKYCVKRLIAIPLSCLLVGCVWAIDEAPLSKSFLFGIGLLPILLVELNSLRIVNERRPAETEALTERYGIFVLILIGETILALILTSLEIPDDDYDGIRDLSNVYVRQSTTIVILCFVQMACLYIMYFNGHVNEAGQHALDNPGSPGSCIWFIFHMFLGYGLFIVGSSYKYMIFMESKKEDDSYSYFDEGMEYSQQYSALGVLGCIICILVIRTAHINFKWLLVKSTISRSISLTPLIVLSNVYVEAGSASHMAHLLLVTLFTIFNVVVDSWAVKFEKVETEHDHSHIYSHTPHQHTSDSGKSENETPVAPPKRHDNEIGGKRLAEAQYKRKVIDEVGGEDDKEENQRKRQPRS